MEEQVQPVVGNLAQPAVAEEYHGPERREQNREVGWSLGLWMMRHSRTWAAVMVAHFFILGFVALGVGITNKYAHDQLKRANDIAGDSRTVATYVRDCLQHPEKLTPEAKAATCGGTGGSSSAIIALMNYQGCLYLSADARGADKVAACKVTALQELRGDK